MPTLRYEHLGEKRFVCVEEKCDEWSRVGKSQLSSYFTTVDLCVLTSPFIIPII